MKVDGGKEGEGKKREEESFWQGGPRESLLQPPSPSPLPRLLSA